jgi:hypothetical protein
MCIHVLYCLHAIITHFLHYGYKMCGLYAWQHRWIAAVAAEKKMKYKKMEKLCTALSQLNNL